MNQSFRFTLKDTFGTMEINVGKFFTEANRSTIRKMLSLIKQNCDKSQLKDLYECMQYEVLLRETALSKLSDITIQLHDLLTPLIEFNDYQLRAQQVKLQDQCTKIRHYMNDLTPTNSI